ncbi:hypothetical protein [Kribbella sp. NPDC023855]|uniref:effector-associated constant component EACC1 n=1 Tax=Kribbella sp. NPDC023855 TaxID=3154698 RepID=UPI0033C2DDA7
MTVDETTVTLRIVEGGGLDQLLSLLKDLRQDDQVGARAELQQGVPRQGELGAVLDSITVVAGSGGALTAVVGAVAVWLRTKGAKVSVSVTKGDRSVRIDGERVSRHDLHDLQKLTVALLRQLDEDQT